MREAGVTLLSVAIFSLGHPRAARGRVRLRVARRGPRPSRRRRDQGRARHRHRVPAAVADPQAPRPAAGHRRGHRAQPGRPAGLRRLRAPAARLRAAHDAGDGRALRRASGARALACGQRAGLPRPARLLRPCRGGVPSLAGVPLRRRSRCSTRPGAPPSGPSATTPSRRSCRLAPHPPTPTPPSSSTSPGTPATSCWPLPRPARGAGRGHPARAGDDELHALQRDQVDGLLRLGRGRRRGRQRPLRDRRRPPRPDRAGLRRGPLPRCGAAATPGSSWSTPPPR